MKEMVGNIPSENFLGGKFPRGGGGGLSREEFDRWELFGWEFPWGNFLHDVSILIFSKDYQQI